MYIFPEVLNVYISEEMNPLALILGKRQVANYVKYNSITQQLCRTP